MLEPVTVRHFSGIGAVGKSRRGDPPHVTFEQVQAALKGHHIETMPTTADTLGRLRVSIINRDAIEERQKDGRARQADGGDLNHYQAEIARLLRLLGVFEVVSS